MRFFSGIKSIVCKYWTDQNLERAWGKVKALFYSHALKCIKFRWRCLSLVTLVRPSLLLSFSIRVLHSLSQILVFRERERDREKEGVMETLEAPLPLLWRLSYSWVAASNWPTTCLNCSLIGTMRRYCQCGEISNGKQRQKLRFLLLFFFFKLSENNIGYANLMVQYGGAPDPNRYAKFVTPKLVS